MFSASSAYRAEACAASEALPGGVIETGEYAELGNVIHDFFDIAKTQSRNIALEKYSNHEEFRTLRNIPVDELLSDVTAIATEVTVAYNVYTSEVRYLGHHLKRNYPRFEDGSGWIIGTSDVIGTCALDNVPVVADLKSGDNVGAIDDNLQIGFHVLALHLLTGSSEIYGRLIYTRPPVNEDSHLFRDNNLDFDTFAARLRKAYDGVMKAKKIVAEGGRPPVYPGSHCTYCSKMNTCEKWTGLIKSFAGELEHVQFNSTALTVEKIAELYPAYKQMKKYFDEFDDRLKNLVRAKDGIPLKNGKTLKLVPSSREYIDGKAAIAKLRTWGASEEELEELFKKTKFDRIMECNTKEK